VLSYSTIALYNLGIMKTWTLLVKILPLNQAHNTFIENWYSARHQELPNFKPLHLFASKFEINR